MVVLHRACAGVDGGDGGARGAQRAGGVRADGRHGAGRLHLLRHRRRLERLPAPTHREEVADERSWSDLAFCRKFKVRMSERLTVVFKFRFFMDWPLFPVPCVGNFHQTTVVTNPHDLHPTIKSKPMG